eukprot:COSAG02_NODE_8583_length_2514_cov_1.493996_2_plen_105_part_00
MTAELLLVQILFILDVDNLAYTVGLPEPVQARVEEAGRVELTQIELRSLKISKLMHICLVPLSIISGVLLVGADLAGWAPWPLIWGPPVAAFLLMGACERLVAA